MLNEFNINHQDFRGSCEEIINRWRNKENKVFVLRSSDGIKDTKLFYNNLLPYLGNAFFLAEDASINDRDDQRTGELWSEIRFDPSFKNAYRHSANAQPLHTDGSYIPSFPNASLMCCIKNEVDGGETVFIDSNKLVECLEEEDQDMLKRLKSTEVIHSRSGDSRNAKVITVDKDNVYLNWNYYCLKRDKEDKVPNFLENFFNYLNNSTLLKRSLVEVRLRAGDAVLWKDSEVLHGRNSFESSITSARHLSKCALDVGTF